MKKVKAGSDYDPDPDFHGSDSFTYRANDGTGNSNLATVTITVNPVNDLPVAADDGYSVAEDGTLTDRTRVVEGKSVYHGGGGII